MRCIISFISSDSPYHGSSKSYDFRFPSQKIIGIPPDLPLHQPAKNFGYYSRMTGVDDPVRTVGFIATVGQNDNLGAYSWTFLKKILVKGKETMVVQITPAHPPGAPKDTVKNIFDTGMGFLVMGYAATQVALTEPKPILDEYMQAGIQKTIVSGYTLPPTPLALKIAPLHKDDTEKKGRVCSYPAQFTISDVLIPTEWSTLNNENLIQKIQSLPDPLGRGGGPEWLGDDRSVSETQQIDGYHSEKTMRSFISLSSETQQVIFDKFFPYRTYVVLQDTNGSTTFASVGTHSVENTELSIELPPNTHIETYQQPDTKLVILTPEMFSNGQCDLSKAMAYNSGQIRKDPQFGLIFQTDRASELPTNRVLQPSLPNQIKKRFHFFRTRSRVCHEHEFEQLLMQFTEKFKLDITDQPKIYRDALRALPKTLLSWIVATNTDVSVYKLDANDSTPQDPEKLLSPTYMLDAKPLHHLLQTDFELKLFDSPPPNRETESISSQDWGRFQAICSLLSETAILN